MTELMQANREWANRPDDERYLNLNEMLTMMQYEKQISHQDVRTAQVLVERFRSDVGNKGLYYDGARKPIDLSNWFFSQLCQRLEAPAAYLRELPANLVIDCLKASNAAHANVLVYGTNEKLKALTSPSYGRIYNADVLEKLINLVGDGTGRDSKWKVPGVRKVDVDITKANTTLYASDRDMFVFLADEHNRIEIPNLRQTTATSDVRSLARGFFISNSEVGAGTLRISTFLFDEVCENRIVWGAEQVRHFKIKHTSRAPLRMISEAMPYLEAISKQSVTIEQDRIRDAMNDYVGTPPAGMSLRVAPLTMQRDEAFEWLAKRMPTQIAAKKAIACHEAEEGFVPRSRYDMINAATAYAKTIPYQNERVLVETLAGGWL